MTAEKIVDDAATTLAPRHQGRIRAIAWSLGRRIGSPWPLEAVVAALAGVYVLLLAVSAFTDPDYRTLFVEEFHTGEAGRAKYLFGDFAGEGGRWQSIMSSPAASVATWLALSAFGFGLPQVRLAFLAATIASLALGWRMLKSDMPDAPRIALAASVAFMLSPLATAMRSTSMNELLYLPLFMLTALAVSRALGSSVADRRASMRWLATAALAAGASTLVKIDGFILPLSLAIFILIEMMRGCVNLRQAAAFTAGGVGAIAILAAAIAFLIGPERYLDGVAMTREVIARSPYTVSSVSDALMNVTIRFPRNLDAFLPGASILLFPILIVGALSYRRLPPAGRFASVCLGLSVLWSAAIPLIYYKKMLVAYGAALVLGAHVMRLSLQRAPAPEESGGRRRKMPLDAAIGFGAAIGVLPLLSDFNGMWRVDAAWRDWTTASAEAWLALAAAAAIMAGALRFGGRRCMIAGGAITLTATALAGAMQFQPSSFKRETFRDGRALAELIDGGTVVSDHNGYRYAAYFTRAPFLFTHENDPAFPGALIENARATRPDVIIVSNTYKPLSRLVAQRLPDYRLVASFSHVHARRGFGRDPTTDEIFIYRRND